MANNQPGGEAVLGTQYEATSRGWPHAELRKQWKPDQQWETLVDGAEHWTLLKVGTQPMWDARQQYRRLAPVVTPEGEAKSEADWQQRVIEERNELEAKVNRLTIFLKGPSELATEDRALLVAQSIAMGTYLSILGQRIARFL